MKHHELSDTTKKETWESVYKDPNHMFNPLLHTFVNTLQASFSVKYTNTKRMTGLHTA
jgi:outer membrane receptor for ferric coprogen and ferric-rhodotorulic acid